MIGLGSDKNKNKISSLRGNKVPNSSAKLTSSPAMFRVWNELKVEAEKLPRLLLRSSWRVRKYLPKIPPPLLFPISQLDHFQGCFRLKVHNDFKCVIFWVDTNCMLVQLTKAVILFHRIKCSEKLIKFAISSCTFSLKEKKSQRSRQISLRPLSFHNLFSSLSIP